LCPQCNISAIEAEADGWETAAKSTWTLACVRLEDLNNLKSTVLSLGEELQHRDEQLQHMQSQQGAHGMAPVQPSVQDRQGQLARYSKAMELFNEDKHPVMVKDVPGTPGTMLLDTFVHGMAYTQLKQLHSALPQVCCWVEGRWCTASCLCVQRVFAGRPNRCVIVQQHHRHSSLGVTRCLHGSGGLQDCCRCSCAWWC
jgi:hypothetical protein